MLEESQWESQWVLVGGVAPHTHDTHTRTTRARGRRVQLRRKGLMSNSAGLVILQLFLNAACHDPDGAGPPAPA